jgi:hypothetical protein
MTADKPAMTADNYKLLYYKTITKTKIMKKITLLAVFFFSSLVVTSLHAQTLSNTNWKAYIGDPLNDTITLHIKTDSSFVTNKAGDVLVRSLCKLSTDTLTLTDYDGPNACPAQPGKYKLSITVDTLIFILISDDCEGRAGVLNNLKWKKVM